MSDRKTKEVDQFEKFVKAARDLECDEDAEAFKEKLKKLTEAPPPESVQERKSGRQSGKGQA